MTGTTDASPRDRLFRPEKAPRPGLWIGLLLGAVALSLGACDLTSSKRPGESKEPVVNPDSAALSYSHMPTGTSLPDPGETPLEQKIVGPGEDRTPGLKKSSQSAPSPYGCYLASRPYTDSVRFRSIYLRFPEAVVKSAGTATQRVVYRVHRTEGRGTREGEGVRFAHCTIPETEAAYDLALKQVLYVAGETAGGGDTDEKQAEAKTKECKIREAIVCVRGNCEVKDRWVDCSGSTGSGGGPIGTDPPDGEPAPYPRDDGGGAGGGDDGGGSGDGDCTEILPPPGSDCTPGLPEVNETRLCPSDPLEDMDIRPTCAGIEGGRYGYTRGPNNNQFHGGLDLDADKGTEASAMEGGEVVQVDYLDDFGDYVVVQSSKNENRYFLYAHFSSIDVNEDDIVSMGDKLGETGKSGNADEAECNEEHLHLEVRKGDGTKWGWTKDSGAETVNPEEYIGTNFDKDGEATADKCLPVLKRKFNT